MASLRSLVETALTNYLTDQSVGATVYSGLVSTDKDLPCVICQASAAEEDPIYSGNYRVECSVMVKDTAAAGSVFDAVAEAVRDALRIDNASLAAALEAQSTALTVFAASAPHRQEWSTEEDCWVENNLVELYCCPRERGS